MWIGSTPAIAGVDRDLVPDSATAISIATIVLKTYLGDDRFITKTKNQRFIAKPDGNDWSSIHIQSRFQEMIQHPAISM